jgi:hypothetical protein
VPAHPRRRRAARPRLLLQEWVSAIHGAIPSLAGMDGYLLKAAKKSGHGKERRRWFALRGQEML